MRKLSMIAAGLAAFASPAFAADDPTVPRPIPLTRPDMKVLLEDMKARKPRIPLPELTAEEKAKIGERGERGGGGYEGRIRALYMPAGSSQSFGMGGGGREADPNISLDYKFKTQLFWIVSRTNNCQYCLGHQESKLLGAGMTEDEIAALDGDWSEHSPAQKAAYAFARKFTYEPHKLSDADIDELRKHYKDLQILEMILSMAGNNSINRWKEGAGVPQSASGGGFRSKDGAPPKEKEPEPATPRKQTYLTPTSEAFKSKVTKVAPLQINEKTNQPTQMTACIRPALEPRAETEKLLAAAAARTPRLPLVEEAKAREILGETWPAKTPLPQWVRLVVNFNSGKGRVASERSAVEKGDLTLLLKAQVSWIIARQDRAWYATGEAQKRLKALGQTDDQIFALDGDWSKATPAEQSLYTLARKLAASPVVLTDADVEKALKLTGPKEVVQLISYTTNRASFDRITEAAGLAIEK
ncbi:carboxymuconolactone decarboxylase family protein [Zavarzinella formosa]|uniref:carboxymuconolactone decarboxylase family protein n=1 Tax=Zavarzinella formosa TaxID=360055 RepID=UPI0002F0BF2D|nr:carboxymuconolactone decarboxylase family protein [Zavarzinella formosa]